MSHQCFPLMRHFVYFAHYPSGGNRIPLFRGTHSVGVLSISETSMENILRFTRLRFLGAQHTHFWGILFRPMKSMQSKMSEHLRRSRMIPAVTHQLPPQLSHRYCPAFWMHQRCDGWCGRNISTCPTVSLSRFGRLSQLLWPTDEDLNRWLGSHQALSLNDYQELWQMKPRTASCYAYHKLLIYLLNVLQTDTVSMIHRTKTR